MKQLERIRVVLVAPSHAGNIGAAARAMKTMGLNDLHLVRPGVFSRADACARAAGAADVLHGAQAVDSLMDAVTDCTRVLGASARPRTVSVPQLSARQGGQWAAAIPPGERTALVFGRERSGLTNTELDLCHRLVQIPANSHYPSLNLAAAVQVLAYECRMAAGGTVAPSRQDTKPAADSADLEGFYEHFQRVLIRTGFLDPQAPRQLMRRLRRLFARARPDLHEIKLLRGILASMEEHLDGKRRR